MSDVVKVSRVGGTRHIEPAHRVFLDGDDIGQVYRSSRGWAYEGPAAGTGGQGYYGYPTRKEAVAELVLAHKSRVTEVENDPR